MNISLDKSITVKAILSTEESDVSNFLSELEALIDCGASRVQLDCSDFTRVSSRQINLLWMARELCERTGAHLELTRVGAGLKRVLEALDLTELFLPQELITDRQLEFTLQPTKESIEKAMTRLVTFLLKANVPEITTFEIQTIFYEIATNIRRHGKLSESATILFDAEIGTSSITLCFRDKGVRFDSTEGIRDVDFRDASREFQRNGFGLTMINRMSSSMEYRYTEDNYNKLTITKVW